MALEATSGSDKIVSIFEREGVPVVVANTRKLKSITDAKAKTDRLNARIERYRSPPTCGAPRRA